MEDLVRLSQADEDRVQKIHKDIKIFDGLATSYLDGDYIKILKEVGINTVHYTVAFTTLVHLQNLEDDFVTACRSIGRWNRILEENKDEVELATSIEEMEKIWNKGKIAIFYGFQNGSPIEDNLDYLKLFYQMGIRFIMITYNKRNFIGSGGGESRDTGLSDFGVKVIKKMNELGIAVDLSHCGDKTSWEAIDISDKPCLFTHANPKKLAPTPRNKDDELIKFCVSKGGLIGPKHMIGNMVNKKAEETTVEDYVDMIDYYVNLVGIDNVSIGTDFSGTVHSLAEANAQIEMIRAMNPNAYIGKRAKPKGFDRIDGLFNVTRCLVKRGYSDADIAKIYSENLRRVLRVIFNEK
jgi:membrane dipeptidase